ncbi:hypothetical protein K443DRAFT_99494 [Laccaria amethystina LaAM-08-1]|uniref:Uncharacterized protein n=1 Tax=Laccaria amethystina LaAM-08-1 TaxID=1095629 RepID=A0A0C9XTA1_9AGAR|nr:hypothetical protein K443DRAFT_99494 [Laccaria amethystina LaAM-08-1]
MASQDIVNPTPAVNNPLEKLLDLIKCVPDTVPEATKYNKLAGFAGHPGDFDIPNLNVDDLWEEVLNKVLKSVLGWGTNKTWKILFNEGRKGWMALQTL